MVRWPSALVGVLALWAGAVASGQRVASPAPERSAAEDTAQEVITRTCATCHNDRTPSGNLSLQSFSVGTAGQHGEITEKMIRKLRAGQMPPPGTRRVDARAIDGLAEALEARADAQAEAAPAPGRRGFQRLNRAEYTRSIQALLALDVNAGEYLPLDTKSANFDNIADAQLLSPTVMQGYLTAAAEISRLAVGDAAATAREATYPVSRWTSQREHVEGAPYGTRGGVSVVHTFPADGDYRFRVSFYHETTGALYGNGRAALHTADAPERVEISIDGARAALLDVDRCGRSRSPSPPVRTRSRPRSSAGSKGPPRI